MNPEEYGIMRQQEDTHWWYRTLRSAVVRNLRPRLADPAPRILDAGCGTGGMLAALRQSFPRAELVGADFEAQAVEITAARHVANHIVRGSLNALPFDSDRFDAMVSLDVLCQADVAEDAAFGELKRVLRPGGLLLLNLPAFDALRGPHDVAVHAMRRYTPRRLADLALANDLRLEHCTCWNMTLFPVVWAWRRMGHLAGARGSDVRPVPVWLNRMTAAMLRAEWSIADRVPLPLGSSVFAILRRAGAP